MECFLIVDSHNQDRISPYFFPSFVLPTFIEMVNNLLFSVRIYMNGLFPFFVFKKRRYWYTITPHT